ncbi:ComEC/Rec2 family competence protein [Ruegeria sp. YS9]|uniref:ComEC/Rec2 family competence protein n=1 Tax=Ruegeria sp. YS9 TaxID=2966453 RepID=UPI0027D7A090|nr:ComEC/Rec2 family competence protein [Ruegeria sp. YS9]
MRVLARVEAALLHQTGYLFPWTPVLLATGIGLYFGVRVEPDRSVYAGLVCLGIALVALRRRLPPGVGTLAIGGALIAAGFILAGVRAHMVAEPVLSWRYYGPVEGRVVAMDRSASDALRLTLDQVRIGDVPQERRPQRIRLSVHGPAGTIAPGQRIMTTGHLSPPQGPVEPGGFDFRRHAWFQRLGAVGYTRVPVMTIAPATEGIAGPSHPRQRGLPAFGSLRSAWPFRSGSGRSCPEKSVDLPRPSPPEIAAGWGRRRFHPCGRPTLRICWPFPGFTWGF